MLPLKAFEMASPETLQLFCLKPVRDKKKKKEVVVFHVEGCTLDYVVVVSWKKISFQPLSYMNAHPFTKGSLG